MTDLPHGILRNNPGNIRFDGTKWKGLIDQDAKGYCVFSEPLFGIRALAMDLWTSNVAHNRKTVRAMQSVYAPPSENPTNAYVDFVAKRLGVDTDQPINLQVFHTAFEYVRAVIAFENGTPADRAEWFSETEIRTAMQATGHWDNLV